MKKVYVKPEVEYINFYSEEKITNDEWSSSEDSSGINASMSAVGNGFGWS